jgi:hypothetical protein
MPTSSDARPAGLQPIPVTRRYLRRNAQRAMAGSIVRALIELITNARDSALRLLSRGQLSAAEIERRQVEVEYMALAGARRIIVRDRFEGMSRSVMRDKLLRYGESASGFEEGNFVRGINARGAKDVGALGEVKFESICDGMYAECLITEGQYSEPIERAAAQADRERLQILAGNGTVVTLTPFPGVTFPNFEPLARDLEHHVEMRNRPANMPQLPIVMRELRDRGTGRERVIIGFQPEGELILDREIPLPEFAGYGGPARLRLFRSREPLQPCLMRGGIARMWRSEAGVVVTDGHTGHDITLFHARGADEPAAQYLYGELSVPQIAKLLREYERFEVQREADSSVQPPELNPEQVTDPDRLGLNTEHPFVQALQEELLPIIEGTLTAIQQQLTPAARDRVSAELRQALDRLGEQLAERLDTGSGEPAHGQTLPQGLTIIPPGVRLELGRSKRLGIYYRVELPTPGELPPCSIAVSSEAVYLPATSIQLEAVPERPGVFRGSFEVAGRQLTDLVLVKATLAAHTATARLSVREPGGSVVLDRDLQFSQRRYTSVPGRRKRVELFADPALADRDVEVRAVREAVALSASVVRLDFDTNRGIAVGSLHVESTGPARDNLHARCGDLTDEGVIVFEEVNARPKLEFILDDVENFAMPGRRFLWESPTSNRLHLAARHGTLARVLGPAAENWPGQNHPQSRAILAELVAEAYVYRRIQADLPSLGTGTENAVDPVEYESYRYRYFEEVLVLCHSLLTPTYSAS